MKKNTPNPLVDKEDIQKSPDKKIDQDFPQYPHGHSAENIINPASDAEQKTADIDNRDGKKQQDKVAGE